MTRAREGEGRVRGLDQIDTWVFDLDNTLYPASCRLFDQVDRRMGEFICDFLKIDLVEARALQKRYFLEFGTTLSGLMANHGCPPERFLEHVHRLDLSPVQPDPALDRALAKLPGRKLIFTNGSVRHAENVMDRLGVARRFEGVFDIVAANYAPKPRAEAYAALVDRHRIEPRRAALIEDLPRNLEPAAALGMTTVLVLTDSEWAAHGADGDHIDHITDDLVAWLEAAAGPHAAAPAGD